MSNARSRARQGVKATSVPPSPEEDPIIPPRPPPPPPPDRRLPERQPSQPDLEEVGDLPTRAPSRRDGERLPVRRIPSHVIVDSRAPVVHARAIQSRGGLDCSSFLIDGK